MAEIGHDPECCKHSRPSTGREAWRHRNERWFVSMTKRSCSCSASAARSECARSAEFLLSTSHKMYRFASGRTWPSIAKRESDGGRTCDALETGGSAALRGAAHATRAGDDGGDPSSGVARRARPRAGRIRARRTRATTSANPRQRDRRARAGGETRTRREAARAGSGAVPSLRVGTRVEADRRLSALPTTAGSDRCR